MQAVEPTLDQINTLTGATLLEFGASWCSYCQSAKSTITAELARFPSIRHIQIEDGKGRRLGRAFHVKLWPTLVLIREGVELARLVRQIDAERLHSALTLISGQ